MPDPIRMAHPDDVPAIAALVAEAYAPWIPVIGAVPGPLRDDYAVAVAAGQVHVLEGPTGAITGLAVLIPQSDAMLIDNIAVARAAQGRGIGTRLMAWAEKRARAQGLPKMRLYTHEKMVTNIALYTRSGYVETARVTERGLHRVYMEKPLHLPDP